ncbi:hypothetical protein OG625_21060 [Streptomyces sp. NBC_01351]|uniref:hypothetical protein n=1 Tax=Streptomyces sp. NBC_01351 TaxID=2903833 RepID=UPI002E303069|nr:hypothetical protein [Streptomyces sp. NBC_01351]
MTANRLTQTKEPTSIALWWGALTVILWGISALAGREASPVACAASAALLAAIGEIGDRLRRRRRRSRRTTAE